MDWIHSVEDRDQRWAVVNVVPNHYIPEHARIFVTG